MVVRRAVYVYGMGPIKARLLELTAAHADF